MPPPGLLYAQVVKTRDHGRIVQVESKVVFGDPQAIAEKLTVLPTSATIKTSFVERHNLTQRQSNRRLTRRTKENTQKIESKHINLRTRIKRLVRCTLCFSKTERMHDLVIGLFINRYGIWTARLSRNQHL